MVSKFDNIPIEKGTKIIIEQEAKFGKYDIFYQQWSWDGINAESIIFVSKDVEELNDSELEAEVRESPIIKAESTITIKRSDSGFTFVNFNFETEE